MNVIRLMQQIRLWIYMVIMVTVIFRIWDGEAKFHEFLIFCLVGILPFLEFCHKCRRVVWLEVYDLVGVLSTAASPMMPRTG